MPLENPDRPSSRRLPAETCPQIEEAARLIGDPQVVAWLQRHYAARTTDGPILRPYDKDAVARFRDGLINDDGGHPALVLADGRAFRADRGWVTEEMAGVDFAAHRPRRVREWVFWVFLALVVVGIVFRMLVLG